MKKISQLLTKKNFKKHYANIYFYILLTKDFTVLKNI